MGLSVVEVRLGKMLQRAEEQESLGKETETENNEISELNNSLENFEKQENVFSEGEQIILEEGGGNSENRVQETGEIEYKRNEEGLDTDDFMTEIRMWQETSGNSGTVILLIQFVLHCFNSKRKAVIIIPV